MIHRFKVVAYFASLDPPDVETVVKASRYQSISASVAAKQRHRRTSVVGNVHKDLLSTQAVDLDGFVVARRSEGLIIGKGDDGANCCIVRGPLLLGLPIAELPKNNASAAQITAAGEILPVEVLEFGEGADTGLMTHQFNDFDTLECVHIDVAVARPNTHITI